MVQENEDMNENDGENDNNGNSNGKTPIRFLGKGDRAVVRPGVVLVSPNHEYSHWL